MRLKRVRLACDWRDSGGYLLRLGVEEASQVSSCLSDWLRKESIKLPASCQWLLRLNKSYFWFLVGFVVVEHVPGPDSSRHGTTCDALPVNGMIVVIASPYGSNDIGCKAGEPDILGLISSARLPGHGNVAQESFASGSGLDHVLHAIHDLIDM